MVQCSKEVLGVVALSGTLAVFVPWLLKRVFPTQPRAEPSQVGDQSPPQSHNASEQFVTIPRVQEASDIQDYSQEKMTTTSAPEGGAGPSTDPFRMNTSDTESGTELCMEEMLTTRRGAGQKVTPYVHPLQLHEHDLSPVLLEIFTSGLWNSDSGQLEHELGRIQQCEAWQSVTGNVPVIALVYRVPPLFLYTCRGFPEDPDPDPVWMRRQGYYESKLAQSVIRNTPQIVVQGSVSVDNVRTLARLIPNVARTFSLGIEDWNFDFKHDWNTGKSWLNFTFSLDLRWGFEPGMLIMVAVYETETLCKCVTGGNPALDIITRKFVVKDYQLCYIVDSRFLVEVMGVGCETLLWKGFCKYNFGVVVVVQDNKKVCGSQHFIYDQEDSDPHIRKYMHLNCSVCRSKSL